MLILKITTPSNSMNSRGLNGLQRIQIAFELTAHRVMIIFIALGLSDSSASGLASCVKIQLVSRAKERQRATVGNWRVDTGLEALNFNPATGCKIGTSVAASPKIGTCQMLDKGLHGPAKQSLSAVK